MSAREYDLVILGGGTGGYVAAIRAAQLGKSVAVVEKDKLGGTCLHRGCIPSKSLLRSAQMFAEMKQADTYGVRADSVTLDFARVQERKQEIVGELYEGVQTLMRKNRIDVYEGRGCLIGPSIFSPKSGTIAVESGDGQDEEIRENLTGQFVIIATGSRPRLLPGWEADGVHVLTSDEALRMDRLPESILIVGGGVIGLEWASMLNDFGVEVTLVETAERLIPMEDEAISKEMKRMLEKRGVIVHTGTELIADSKRVENGQVRVRIRKDGDETELAFGKILVSVGREPNTDGIGLENTGVETGPHGIVVNKYLQTAESHIYAIGDCIGGRQLAHAASHQGILAVEHMFGESREPYDPLKVPRCIYTRPEAASVGMTEREAREKGYEVKIGTVPFRAVGKALVIGEKEGFAKVISDRRTDDLLGVHLIGPGATDLISEAALARLLDATPWEVGKVIHPHPTLSEVLGEAMLATDKKAIGI